MSSVLAEDLRTDWVLSGKMKCNDFEQTENSCDINKLNLKGE